MKLIFYNNWHNGDLHFVRDFVKDIIKKTNYDEYYILHKNSSKLLKDIPNLIYGSLDKYCLDSSVVMQINDNIYINTWLGCVFQVLSEDVSEHWFTSLESYYKLFKYIYNILNLEIEKDIFYIPEINYEVYDISNVKNYVNNGKFKILIENSDFHSYQSQNFNFSYVINKLSDDFNNIDFILTKKTNEYDKQNILFTSDITNCENGDLNEISYLSTFCDIIIGRSSGPYVYTETKNNLNNINKTYISISDKLAYALFYLPSKCNKIWINQYDEEFIYEIIKKEIEKKSKNYINNYFQIWAEDNKIFIKCLKQIDEKISINFIHNNNLVWNISHDSYNTNNILWVIPFQSYQSDVHNMKLDFYNKNDKLIYEKTIK